MPHYLFHLHECGTICHDDEGRDYPDLAAAIRAATKDAKSILCDEVDAGELCLSCHIEIIDTATDEMTTLPFRDVVRVVGLS